MASLDHAAEDEVRSVCTLLLRALCCARDLRVGEADFAVSIRTMHKHGVTDLTLRWLCATGYLQHLLEATTPYPARRDFEPGGSFAFSDKSCFLLTPEGQRFARRLAASWRSPTPQKTGSEIFLPPSPTWDVRKKELWAGDLLVKYFPRPAPTQELLLLAFEEDAWPPCIDDPLPPSGDMNPRERLQETVKRLNRRQHTRLILFSSQTGQRVCWRWRPKHG